MHGPMTKFENWMLKRIARRLVVQSPSHASNIAKYYEIMTEAAEKEFREDNVPTVNSFLQEQFEKAKLVVIKNTRTDYTVTTKRKKLLHEKKV